MKRVARHQLYYPGAAQPAVLSEVAFVVAVDSGKVGVFRCYAVLPVSGDVEVAAVIGEEWIDLVNVYSESGRTTEA